MMRSLFQHRLPFGWHVLFASLVGVASAGVAIAEPPDDPIPCILLRNGNVLEGKPIQEGDRITILIGEHQSLRLPANQVLCWADDRLQLYRYRLEHRTKSDLLTHLEAARWCIRENLWEPASAELKAAQSLDAEHPRVTQVEAMLRTARQRAGEAPDPRIASSKTEWPSETEQRSEGEAQTDRNPTEPPVHPATTLARLSKSTIANYASRVQPILINCCGQAGCHGGDGDPPPDWRLTLSPSRQYRRLPAATTRKNLRDLVQWIDRNEPRSSPLLRKASESHAGMKTAPLGAADDDVLAELESWITSVAGELRDDNPPDDRRIATLPAGVPSVPLGPLPEKIDSGEPLHRANRTTSVGSRQPKRLPPVTNPFDPQVFNRMHHRDASNLRR